MTLSKAQEEFWVRYYRWARSEFEREIDEAFPSLGLFNTGANRATLQFMRKLNGADRRTLAHSLLKRFHPDAVSALDEQMSNDEKSLLSRLDDFRLTEDVENVSRSPASNGSKVVSSGKLRRMILTKFKSAFGHQCFDLDLVGLDPELIFKMKCCGWILETRFEFKGKHRQIHYWHDIVSPTVIEPYRAPAMIVDQFISLDAWLGICSQTEWGFLTNYDAEPACDSTIKFCGRFFEVAPMLLEGLEFDRITGE